MAPPLVIVRMQIQLLRSACASIYNVRHRKRLGRRTHGSADGHRQWIGLIWLGFFGSLNVSDSKIGIPENTDLYDIPWFTVMRCGR